ncbi:hypothetical protein EV361DRAFT_28619 [Lentinula raphanica]|uniref:Uncharacterized protein n=1 Tax=Lentinula raphanica TaxID=153919 RepID=A0AA38UJ28_9AGAR|nr:hypothetical protein F5878DRAFT_605686 [Lentinula raphanica]KAJ3973778.1 hypothetical protein EV361DRAFT_28619 [Lentinula raphanica]
MTRSYTPIAIHPPDSLRTLLSLPNELLHSIIEYTAYTYEPVTTLHSPLKHASPAKLFALSAVNWQFRRLCMPFLFAKLVIWLEKDIQKLKDGRAHLTKFTKTLVIADISESGDQALSQIIPEFQQLSNVELRLAVRGWDGIHSLKVILAHPTVASILVYKLPDESMCNHDLSKVVLDHTDLSRALSPTFGKYLNRGMRIRTLDLSKDESLDSQFGSKILSRLETLCISDHTKPDSLSWLSLLSSTHPTLNELWLLVSPPSYAERYTVVRVALPPFPFITKSQRQDLDKCLAIQKIGFRRAVGPFPLEWDVTALSFTAWNFTDTIAARTSLIKILELVAISFPKLEMLILDLDRHVGMYDIGDLVSAFARFSSLRVVEFHNVFRRLKFGPELNVTLMLPVQRDDFRNEDASRACAERVLLTFAARLAKQVRTLDSIYINDCNFKCLTFENIGYTPPWHFSGWFHVLNVNRDIGGIFN